MHLQTRIHAERKGLMIGVGRMTAAEFRELIAPDKWLTTGQSLALTAAILVIGGICIYRILRVEREMLIAMAALCRQAYDTYETAPPEARFRIEMWEREHNPDYQRFLKTTAKGREWDARFQQWLLTPQGVAWRARYEADRQSVRGN